MLCLNFKVVYIVLCIVYFTSVFQINIPAGGIEFHFSNESRCSNLSNDTMGKIEYDALRYFYTVVLVFGILGNILVLLSKLRQKRTTTTSLFCTLPCVMWQY